MIERIRRIPNYSYRKLLTTSFKENIPVIGKVSRVTCVKSI